MQVSPALLARILEVAPCRIRPLNTTEEKMGSKVIVKFPAGQTDDQCITIGVGHRLLHTTNPPTGETLHV